MAAASGPRWRRRSGRTHVGECPKQSSSEGAAGPWPLIHMCIYIGARLCQQLGCRSGCIIRQRLTITSERKKRLLLICRRLDISLEPLAICKAEFKVTLEVGDMGEPEIREIRLDLRV